MKEEPGSLSPGDVYFERLRDVPDCVEVPQSATFYMSTTFDVMGLSVNENSHFGRRLRSYRTKRHFRVAFFMWAAILAVALSRSKVQDVPQLPPMIQELMKNHMPNLEDAWTRFDETVRTSLPIQERMRPGFQLAKEGAKAKYPIVMIPGFVTSSLELWQGQPCAKHFFRQKMWGGVGPSRSFFTDRECWKAHLSLDPKTGMDPPGIKLRPTQSFDGADFFLSRYWVWDKLIQNLADVGYDAANMSMETYDWRLAFPLLEKRDGFFTKLKVKIEALHKTTGEKVVVLSHSMGSLCVHFFFAWVTTTESQGGGGGGKDWVNKHIHAEVNIAGPLSGVAKSVPSLLSGEFKDMALMTNNFWPLEQFWGRAYRKSLWQSWGSLWSLLPTGGKDLWGPEPFLSTTDSDGDEEEIQGFFDGNRDIDEVLDFLYESGERESIASSLQVDSRSAMPLSAMSWHDTSRTPLPWAPKMKMYCLYGHGLPTENTFVYKRNSEVTVVEQGIENETDTIPYVMDTDHEEDGAHYGAKMSDGDASVSLISLGYMCVEGWNSRSLNPSGIQVTTREYENYQEFSVEDPIRGGPRSSEHVDILGNVNVVEDILRIATDFNTELVSERITSNIEELAGGVRARKRDSVRKRKLDLSNLKGTLRRLLASDTSLRI